MQVRELSSIETLHSFRLLAGEDGLDHSMKDVVLLEYESLKQETPDFYREDLIISTLFYAKDDPQVLLAMVERLIDLGAAGLAFKSVYYTALPQPVLDLANARSFPIFIFEGLYMEDVILGISDYIRLQQEFSLFEEPLCTLLLEEGGDIPQLCSRLNPGRQKYMCAVYIHAATPETPWAGTLRDALRMRTAQERLADYRFLQFRRGFFAIRNDAQEPQPGQVADQCAAMLKSLGIPVEQLRFGVSAVHQRSEEFGCVIREAFDALTAALAMGQPRALFSEVGFYHMLFPMLRDKSARERNARGMALLARYDMESGSGSLIHTLQTYAEDDYDIRKTAQDLGQHPNTIRYRLKKIGELLGAPRHTDEALFLLGEYLRLDALRQMIF